MKRFLSFLLLFGAINCYAQDCSITESECEKVEIRLMETKNIKGFTVSGEATAKVSQSIRTTDDLSEKEKKEIRKTAAKYGACIVYIDTMGLWDSKGFPTMASQGKLYYYWGSFKK